MRAPRLMAMCLGLAGCAAGDPAPAHLDGAWTAVEATRNGAAATDVVGHRLELDGERFRISNENALVFGGTYTTDPTTEPPQIDFRLDEGEAAGTNWLGIYEVAGGRLGICDNAPDPTGPRPTDLTAGPGSGRVLVVFAR